MTANNALQLVAGRSRSSGVSSSGRMGRSRDQAIRSAVMPDARHHGQTATSLSQCCRRPHLCRGRRERDRVLQRGIRCAGAEQVQPVTDMFYGATSGSVRDPFGHVWVLLSWKEDPEPAEIERRGSALSRR